MVVRETMSTSRRISLTLKSQVMDIKCSNCDGSGRIKKQESINCTKCGGYGRVTVENGEQIKCDRCWGSGKLQKEVDEACAVCYGTGKIKDHFNPGGEKGGKRSGNGSNDGGICGLIVLGALIFLTLGLVLSFTII